MNLVLTVLEITAPVFLLAGAGFAWDRLGFEYRMAFVTRLTMSLAIPCLIFTALMETEIEPAALGTVSLAAIAAYGALGAAMWAIVRGAGLNLRTYLAPLVFGNTGNIGLPLAFFAFGAEGLGFAVVVFAISAILVFTFGVWIVAGGGNPGRVLREPIVAASVLGLLFLWQGWQTPVFLTNTLTLLGQAGIPLMLITLGVAVARLPRDKLAGPVILSLLKATLSVAMAWAVGLLFGLGPVPFAILVLQIGTPVAVTSYLLAERYKADPGAVAGLVVVSTLIAVVQFPVLLAVLL